MSHPALMTKLLRLVPGATSQPHALAKRRLVTGVTIVVVSIVLQTVPSAMRAEHALPVIVRFSHWLLEMVALTVALSATYDWNQRRRAGTALTLVHTLVVAAMVSAVSAAIHAALINAYPFLRTSDGPPRSLAVTLSFGMVVGMLHTGLWALAFVFPYVAEDARLRAVEADKLRIEADHLKSAAELARLRSQLEPHFLLNTLNAIAGLVTENPREARRLIACLGDLLRDSLEDADDLQPLEAEFKWLRRYADILESRHAGVLSFHWDIDSKAERTMVPRLLLQPLVENAVKHGALRRREGGKVTVRASFDDHEPKRVVCIVEDNGPGLSDAEPRAGAFGLRSVRRRLELKYPDAVLRMESSASGTRSIVELPAEARRSA
jgi:signal transduction histidine kinase